MSWESHLQHYVQVLEEALNRLARSLTAHLLGEKEGAAVVQPFLSYLQAGETPNKEEQDAGALTIVWNRETASGREELAVGVPKVMFFQQVRKCVEGWNNNNNNNSSSTVVRTESDMLDGGKKYLLSKQAVQQRSLEEVALLLLALPSNTVLWSRRRQEACRVLTPNESTTPASSTNASSRERFLYFSKEYGLTSLLLSALPKVQEVWVYRLWILRLWVTACRRDSSISLSCAQAQLLLQEDPSFFFAAEKHHLNYNAWQYRRGLFVVLKEERTNDIQKCITEEITKALDFLRTHNSDSSVVSYTLFLLQQVEKEAETVLEGQKWLGECWRRLFHFTQQEIRLRVDKGHECMWYLRLELVRWVLQSTLQECMSWTVRLELEWVSTYVEGFRSSYGADTALLAPVNRLPDAWAACSGNECWSSYYACRYGLQLVKLLA